MHSGLTIIYSRKNKMHKINHANIKDWAKNYDGPLFDGILCDPPYELGFMGKSWDSSGIAFDTEMWADILKLLKPGAHLLAFSGSRTYHRMAVAIEDAGFEIRDMIEWVYGSGFPKSLNIGKAVDKLQGNDREVVGITPAGKGIASGGSYVGQEYAGEHNITKGTSEWEGYGTALKPAHEPICMARKPLSEKTVAENCLKWGTGGINIDESRVPAGEDHKKNATRHTNKIYPGGFNDSPINSDANPLGRFPANLIHDGSDEVVGLFPQTKSGGGTKVTGNGEVKQATWTLNRKEKGKEWQANSGSASRFFFTAKPDEEMYSLKYCAKASKRERNAGLDDMPDMPMAMSNQAKAELKRGNTDFAGHKEGDWNGIKMLKNNHPTVKPLSLTKYLATLIKPPTGGRLLVPFSGSGSEMIGALQAGWEYVEGVELTEEYIPIAEARIKYWLDQMAQEDAKPKQVGLV